MAITVPIISTFSSKGVDEASDKIGGFGKRASKAFKAVGIAAAAAGGAVAAGLGAAVKAAADDAAEQAKLSKALKNNANATDDAVAAIEKQISAMTLATGVADSDLRKGLENLVRATGSAELSMETLQAAMDISAATGKDLDGVTMALGKAYNGQFTALKKLGVPLSENVMETKNFSGAMDELNMAFGGTQAELADTAAGRFQRLKTAFSEASESIGSALLPAFEGVVGFATKTLIPAFQKVSDTFEEKGFKGVAQLFGDTIKSEGPKAIAAVGEVLRNIGTWIVDVGLPLLGEKLGKLKEAFTNWIKESGDDVGKNLGKWLGIFVDWIINKAVPKIIETTAQLSVALLKWLVDIGPSVAAGVANFALELTKSLVSATIEAIKKLGSKALDIGKAFANAIIDVVNREIIGRINSLLEFKVGPVKINPPDIPPIPALADGGIVTRPTLALIGEAGPEAVVPLNRANSIGGGGITINVHGGDPRAVVDALRRYNRSNGPAPVLTYG